MIKNIYIIQKKRPIIIVVLLLITPIMFSFSGNRSSANGATSRAIEIDSTVLIKQHEERERAVRDSLNKIGWAEEERAYRDTFEAMPPITKREVAEMRHVID